MFRKLFLVCCIRFAAPPVPAVLVPGGSWNTGSFTMNFRSIFAASAALLLSSAAANAAQVAALIGGDTIATVDTAQKKATGSVKVTGISGALVGIDVRPADGMLYGLVDDGTIVTIAMDGKATMKSKLDTMLAKGVAATVDFNPVADRLRVMGADGMNLRANVDDGKVTKDGDHKYADSDMHKGEKADSVAFDIWSDGTGKNEAWLMADGTLYSVDLATGKATEAAKIAGVSGKVKDIAIMGM